MFWSSKKSVSQTTANQTTSGVSNDGSGAAVSLAGGSGNTVNVTDGGAIAGAFDFLGKQADRMTTQFSALLANGQESAKTAAGAMAQAITDAQKTQANPNQNLVITGVLALSAVAVVYFWKGK